MILLVISTSLCESKHSEAAWQLKTLEENGVFAGYASVFNVVDSQNDVVTSGAFTASIRHRTSEIKLLWQHDLREPIGVIEALYEDERGLYIRGRLLINEVARAKEAYHLLQRGVVKGLSIGYTPRRWSIDPNTKIRHIAQLDLWEISLVTFPANEAAQITVVKSTVATDHALTRDTHRLYAALHRAEHALYSLINS
jgi:uncharacterized protein